MAHGKAMMAPDRPHAGRDYAWRGARCIILRSGDIAVRNTPAAGRCVRVCALVTSDGIGGTDGFGGTVPLFVTSDGIGGTGWLRRDGAVIRDLRWLRRDRWLWRGGAVRGWARPGGGRARIRVRCGWFGHGVFPLARGGPPQHPRATAGSAAGRNAATENRRARGTLADAQQGRRQRPAAAAQGGRYRAGPTAGTGGCTPAEPPAASSLLLSDGMTSGSTRPGQGRPSCGPGGAGLHRVTAAAGQNPGPAASKPGTGIVSRDAAVRASWAPTIVMTAPMRTSSSGSPGKLAAAGG